MARKKHYGFVVGKKVLDNGFLYFVTTERSDWLGDYVCFVFSKTEYCVADEIEFYYVKKEGIYKAYA